MQEAKVCQIPANVAGQNFLLRNSQWLLLPLSHPLRSQRMDHSGSKMPNEDIIRGRKKTRGEESRGTVSKGLRGSMAWQLEAEMLWSQAAEVQISALAKQSWGPLSEVEEGECRDPSDEVEGGC